MKNKATLKLAGLLKCFVIVAALLLVSQFRVQACNVRFTYSNTANTDSVHFLASVTNATGYSWTFGDGTSGGTADPLHVYAAPGKYYVCLTIKDSNTYCNFCDTIVVSGPLCNAKFVYYAVTHNPDSIHFGANPGFELYSWSFGDGVDLVGGSSIAQHPFHLYKPGTYFPCLTVTTSGEITCTYCDSVKIAGPSSCNARFLNYSLSGHPDSIHFYPATLTGTVYYWNFGDGSTSTGKDPWHLYKAAGTYIACLTVKDSGVYCNTCDTIKITGVTPCNAHFSQYRSTANRDSVHFYPTSTVAATAYHWTFGDGSTSGDRFPWHWYKTPGTYQVCLTVRDSLSYCNFCDTITIEGAKPCVAKFEYYHVTHNPDSIHFGAAAGATSYYWSFGDGTHSSEQHPFHLYTTAGTYYVCLSVNDSGTTCSFCDTVVIAPKVTCNAQFSHYSITNPDSLHFYPTTTTKATSYSWSFGDGTYSTLEAPWHNYKTAGKYSVCLTVNVSGTVCESCDTVTVRSVVSCNAQFVHYSHDSVHFGASTANATAYYWSFGDGTHSTLKDPWHNYKTAGTYDACLYVNDSGTYCTWCDTIVISGSTPCNARFSHYSITNPDSVHFYPVTTGATSYYWSFGDGTSSSDATPWHRYKTSGTYYACLTVNVAGTYCEQCDTIVIKAITTCNASFSYINHAKSDTVYFSPQTANASSYYWNFGDGTRSTERALYHIYSKAGSYLVCLYVNDSGTYCEQCDTVVVTGGHTVVCNAKFLYYQRHTSDTAQFYPNLTTANSYYWNFSDGTTSTAQAPDHVFSKPGTYDVCLTVNDSGTYCEWCDTVTIKGTISCNARFSHYSTTNPDSIHFYPATTGATSYSWAFGDGTSSSSSAPWHRYKTTGTFTACLTVNVSGTSCTSCDTIVIKGASNCNAKFSHYTLTNSDSTHFYPAITSAISYAWSFGDGTSSDLATPWHNYKAAGTYYACLSVNDSGTTCTTCDTVVVTGRAKSCNAAFTHYSAGSPDSIHFYPSTTKASSYYWSFGDGTTSTSPAPWHTYKAPGTYSACLYVNDSGTYCNTCDTIVIHGAVACNAEFNHREYNHSDTVLFLPSHIISGNSYYWSFGDGTTSATGPTQQHIYKAPGNYTVCLYVNDSGTYCTTCDTVVVTGSAPPCNAQFVHYAASNLADSIHFYPNTTNAISYFWSFGDGSTSTTTAPWHKYTAAGIYYACLAINDSITYCTWCDTIIIRGSTPCNAMFGHYSLSNPDSVHFYPLATTAVISYDWTFSDGGTSTSQDPWHHFATPGTYYACLTVTDSSGYCSSCDTVNIAGVTPCNAEFAHYAYNKNADSIYFYPTGAQAVSYYWSFGDGGSSTSETVWHTFKAVGTYYACLAVNDTGAYCIWCDTVRITTLTGIPTIEAGTSVNIQVYPNPMNEYTIVSLHNTTDAVSLHIFDLLGREVYNLDNIRDGIYTINTKNILQGLYYYTVMDNNQVVSGGKLIVVH